MQTSSSKNCNVGAQNWLHSQGKVNSLPLILLILLGTLTPDSKLQLVLSGHRAFASRFGNGGSSGHTAWQALAQCGLVMLVLCWTTCLSASWSHALALCLVRFFRA